MTRDEAEALAETRNRAADSGRWFAREQEGAWGVVRVAAPFTPLRAVPGQEPKRGVGPDPAPSMPGLVTPWNAGT